MKRFFLLFSITLALGISSRAQVIPFDTTRWEFVTAKPAEFAGRSCIAGKAILKGKSIANGVVEVDMAVTGQRSYPGILFRMASGEEFERVYIRPHLPPLFQNVVQYVSTFNGIDSWQLYSGPGYTTSAEIPKNTWFHVKIAFSGEQAAVYLNNSETPVLEIPHLGHGQGAGSLGIEGPDDGTAYFSGFSCHEETSLKFPSRQPEETPFGVITGWQLSQVFKLAAIDNERTPAAQGITNITWTDAYSRSDGIVDISRYYGRLGNAPDLVFARTTIESDKECSRLYAFGYSDVISVFVNGKLIFCGNSSYTSRDPNFQGIVGLNDYVNIPLKKGRNELMIALAETFGGWGFIFRDAKALYMDSHMKQSWEIRNRFRVPESVQYDTKRDVLYVSNYFNDGKEFISKISPKGEVLSMEWATGIYQPAGMTMSHDKLYVVGRMALVEIDPESGKVTNRYRFPEPGLPNDVAADDAGNLYVTDSRKSLIYKLENGSMTEWLKSPELTQANGLIFSEGRLIAGTSGDGCIKTIDPASKAISTMVCLGEGAIMDGIAYEGNGNYLISDFNGKIYRVNRSGEKKLVLNSTAPGMFCAAFEYIPGKHLLVVPTFTDNRVVAFELAP